MEKAAVTLTEIFNVCTYVFNLIMDQFATTVETITNNPLLFASVIIALAGGLIMAGVTVMKKLGVRGLRGRRRRR